MQSIKFLHRSENKESNKNLLKSKKIPCVIYGKNYKTASLLVESKTIIPLIKNKGSYSTIIPIELDGKEENVLLKEVQFHPVTNNVIHIDLLRVQDKTKVTVEVPVSFLNKDMCPGLKQGGVLNTVRRNVELVCNANQIPKILEFDLFESDIGDSIKISNIVLPEGVKPTITDRDFVIATLVPPTVEVEPEKTEEETSEDGETDSAISEKTDETSEKKDSTSETKGDASKSEKENKEDKK